MYKFLSCLAVQLLRLKRCGALVLTTPRQPQLHWFLQNSALQVHQNRPRDFGDNGPNSHNGPGQQRRCRPLPPLLNDSVGFGPALRQRACPPTPTTRKATLVSKKCSKPRHSSVTTDSYNFQVVFFVDVCCIEYEIHLIFWNFPKPICVRLPGAKACRTKLR